MRLIDARSLKLEELPDNRLPRYAILSHTWEDDEVTFEQMPRAGRLDEKAPTHKRGYKKIRYACEQAQKDRLSHVWVDTCCIDKKSSAELQETINSMYRYYADANICYVYLGDVIGGCPILRDEPVENITDVEEIAMWKEFFMKSKWFTRGWTLQELLAPKDVRLYSREWRFIGRKKELTETISITTRIDPSILAHEKKISSISVAQRMTWAASRETTRLEDQAYCLLGIFGVNMPMLYGEGSKAFIRLQEEIIKTCTDHSIFAWEFNGKVQADGSLLAASPSNFASTRNIVPWGKPAAFAITNRGLQMLLRTLTLATSDTETIAMLNCRYDDDLSRTLALRLWRYEGGEDYHTLNVDPGSVEPERTVSRLTFITESDMDRLKEPVLFQITREFEVEASKILVWIERSDLFRLSDGYPEGQWIEDKRLMYGANSSRFTGGVSVETSAGRKYDIAFSISQMSQMIGVERKFLLGVWGLPWGVKETRFFSRVAERVFKFYHDDSEGGRCYGKHCFEKGCPLMSDSLTIYGSEGREHLEVGIRMSKIMEDMVFVITINVKRPYDPRTDIANDVQDDSVVARMQNIGSVRAYQMQVVAEGVWFPLQRNLDPSEADAPDQVWMWFSSSLWLEYTSSTRTRKLADHLLLWTFLESEDHVKGLAAFSTPSGSEVSFFFVGGHSIRWRILLVCRSSSEMSTATYSIKSRRDLDGILDHSTLSIPLFHDNAVLEVSIRFVRRLFGGRKVALLVDIQLHEWNGEHAQSSVATLVEVRKEKQKDAEEEAVDESHAILLSWQTAMEQYEEIRASNLDNMKLSNRNHGAQSGFSILPIRK